jgi:hypothetical protein
LCQPRAQPALTTLTGLAFIQKPPISLITWITCEGCDKRGGQVLLKAQRPIIAQLVGLHHLPQPSSRDHLHRWHGLLFQRHDTFVTCSSSFETARHYSLSCRQGPFWETPDSPGPLGIGHSPSGLPLPTRAQLFLFTPGGGGGYATRAAGPEPRRTSAGVVLSHLAPRKAGAWSTLPLRPLFRAPAAHEDGF